MHQTRTLFFAIFVLASHLVASSVSAQSLVGWRTDGTGRYPDARPPQEWSSEKNVVWKTALPGKSYSSPVLVNDRIFVASDPAELLCVRSSDGEILWQQSNTAFDLMGADEAARLEQVWTDLNEKKNFARKQYSELRKSRPDATDEIDTIKEELAGLDQKLADLQRTHPLANDRGAGNSAATPACDGNSVFAVFGSGIVAAYSLDGNLRWRRFVEGSDLGFGHSSSPVLVEGKVIVHLNDLVALDAASGEIRWRIELPARHATPIVAAIGETHVLVSPAGAVVRVSDGRILTEEKSLRLSESSPVIDGGIIYAQGDRTVALRLPDSVGEPFALETLWESTGTRGRRTPSPILHEGLLYGVVTSGILDVTDAKSGENVYRKRLEIGKNIYSSVTLAGEWLFVSGTDGTTNIFRPGREFTEIARNELESFGSNPVFEGQRMFVRGQKYLYCIGK